MRRDLSRFPSLQYHGGISGHGNIRNLGLWIESYAFGQSKIIRIAVPIVMGDQLASL